MRTISQRELRNDNAVVMREVEDGEDFVVTRRGVPLARIVPMSRADDLDCDRPARTRPRWATHARASTDPTADPSGESAGAVLDDLRGER